MRASAFREALRLAGREALNAFGDGRVLLEKYLARSLISKSRSWETAQGMSSTCSTANAPSRSLLDRPSLSNKTHSEIKREEKNI